MSVISTPITDNDPFLLCDLEKKVHDFIKQSMPGGDWCSLLMTIWRYVYIKAVTTEKQSSWHNSILRRRNKNRTKMTISK